MGTAADYVAAWFGSAGLGLLRLGLACARLASAVVIRVADAWVPLLIMLLLCFGFAGLGCFGQAWLVLVWHRLD